MSTPKRPSIARRSSSRTCSIERLEERWTPAQYGIPWNDPTHLTMSYAPDGTTAAGQPSQLFAALDAQMPRDTWQNALRRAAQTWANVANLNVGSKADQGQAFGSPGPAQGDPRFGDIRIGGLPMAASELAVSTPPASTQAGTFSGDIFINTTISYTPLTLYATALHEFGHTFGLDHSDDPTSIMFPQLTTQRGLGASDVTAIRNLYGLRSIDLNEDTRKTNDTLKDATRIAYSQVSGGYDGSTPVIAFGDISTATDVDYFFIKPIIGYTGAMTFRVQTTGISFLAPQITLFDDAGTPLVTRQSISNSGDTIAIRLASVIPDKTYYLRVTAAPSATYKLGRYGVAVTFDDLPQNRVIGTDTVLRGRFETLRPEQVDQLFKSPTTVIYEDDLHTNDTPATAFNLRPGLGNPNPNALSTQAALSDATDVDVYRVRTPNTGGVFVVTVTTRGAALNSVILKPELLNAALQPVPVTILSNGNNTFTIQATGIAANKDLFVRIAAPNKTGNYTLEVQFARQAADVTDFLIGQVPSSTQAVTGKLYIARTQLMSFLLDGISPGGLLTFTLRDSSGAIVQTLSVRAGTTASAVSQFLKPGEYSFTITASTRMSFKLRGSRLTDPIGPVLDDGTLSPQYGNPDGTYTFPDNVTRTLPYLWILTFI